MSGVNDDPNLKGLSRIFNSQTNTGRANTAKATMGLIAAYFIYRKVFKSKKK